MGWKRKLVSTLIVYAAGFATAIYCLAPGPEQRSGYSGDPALIGKTLKSDEFARSVNAGMHRAVDFGKEAATRATKMVREKIDEARSKSEQ